MFHLAGQEKSLPFKAEIETIAGLADPSTGLVRVVCALDHPPGFIRPGMMLDALFQSGAGSKGLIVPKAALQEIDGRDVVFLRRDATHFMPVEVQIVEQNEESALITGSVHEGEQIVGEGSFTLKSMALLSSMAETDRAMWHFLQANKLAVLALCALLVLAGLFVVPGLPVEPVPDISPQQVLVSVTAPGLATEEVEKQITFPLEASLTGLPALVDLRSVSRTGVSVVYLQFDEHSDLDLDRTRVNERLQKARESIAVPVSLSMGPLATGMGEIMQIQIKGDKRFSPLALNRLMTWSVAPQLRLVPGVAEVNVNGGAEETYTLTLDPARMRAHDIPMGVSMRR